MKKFAVLIIIGILISGLVFLLSTSNFEPIDTLMRPPHITGENAEIQSAFEISVGDKYILKSPLSGNYRSSYILIDITDDGDEEAIVFYCASSTPDIVKMNVLDKIDGAWKSVADITSTHSDIHQIYFDDLDGNGIKEIIVGWSIFETELSNTLNIYSFTDNKIQSVFSKKYTEFLLCKGISGSKSQILLFDRIMNNGHTEIKCNLITDKKDGFDSIGEFSVDPAITSISSVTYDLSYENNRIRFYIDGYRSDSSLTTDLIYWNDDKKHFEHPYYYEDRNVSTLAVRSINIDCTDVNSDGTVEIPFEKQIPESKFITSDETESGSQNMISWMKFEDGDFSVVNYELVNSAKKYSLKIKSSWNEKFTVENNIQNGMLTFYSISKTETEPQPNKNKKPKKKEEQPADEPRPPDNGNIRDEETEYKVDEPLFTVFATSSQDNNLYELTGYRYIKSDNGYSYYCQIYDAGKENGITKEAIKNMLIT